MPLYHVRNSFRGSFKQLVGQFMKLGEIFLRDEIFAPTLPSPANAYNNVEFNIRKSITEVISYLRDGSHIVRLCSDFAVVP